MKEQRYTATEDGQLLSFLLTHIKGQSRNNIKSILSRGQVLVNGRKTTKFDHPIAVGTVVTVRPPEAKGDKLPFQIIHEDDDIIVIDKPAGLLSMANEKEKERTAYHMVTAYMAKQRLGGRVFIVHRLDRDTSGVLLFAKSEKIKHLYQDDWDNLVSHRGYLAVVEGNVEKDCETLCSTLRETSTHLVYSVPSGQPGKEAITHYKVVRRGNGNTLLEIAIDTGRKNQIRVQLSDIGFPIVGDKLYGARGNTMGRLGLHAHLLELTDPKTGTLWSFKAPIPGGFAGVLHKNKG